MISVLQTLPADIPAGFDGDFAREVLGGLARRRKEIACKWFYDARGCELFERITALPEYYLTRAELRLLARIAPEVALAAGPGAALVELGSGSSRKTPLVLAALESPAAYVPIDVAAPFMAQAAAALKARFPQLPIRPLATDFATLSALPPLPADARRLGFFPGSTIGNLQPDDAVALLQRLRRLLGPRSLLLVGADATTDPDALLPAYDDAQGVTATFNLNLLARINRELDGGFDLGAFRHEARHDVRASRVEMHLVSRRDQQVDVLGHRFRFVAGESIHTENSWKYGAFHLQAMARRAGWETRQLWADDRTRFVCYLLAAD